VAVLFISDNGNKRSEECRMGNKKKNNPEKLHGNIGYTRRRKTKQKYSTVIKYVLDTTMRKQTQIT
jgi:hypothetical protein